MGFTMQHDDLQAVAYRILRYSDLCAKADVWPSGYKALEVACASATCAESAMRDLLRCGYISPECAVTLKGAEYMGTNAGMGKARKLHGPSFDASLESAIEATRMMPGSCPDWMREA